MAREISNHDDVIDSRDVIERIEELESDLEAEQERLRIAIELPDHEDTIQGHRDQCEDIKRELTPLRALADEASQYADDWKYGEALIRDSYFTEYAEQLADDLGLIDRDAKWPVNHIDWEAAAEELQTDYTAVKFGDVTYWIR